jgi:hypothetical protein
MAWMPWKLKHNLHKQKHLLLKLKPHLWIRNKTSLMMKE